MWVNDDTFCGYYNKLQFQTIVACLLQKIKSVICGERDSQCPLIPTWRQYVIVVVLENISFLNHMCIARLFWGNYFRNCNNSGKSFQLDLKFQLYGCIVGMAYTSVGSVIRTISVVYKRITVIK